MILWDKDIGFLYTTEWQSTLYAGDLVFDQVPFLVNRQINWGGGAVPITVPAGGSPVGPGNRTHPR